MAHFKSALYVSAGIAAFATLSTPAHAQDTDQDESRTLQTVTITATKREQTLQDVPVASSKRQRLWIWETCNLSCHRCA